MSVFEAAVLEASQKRFEREVHYQRIQETRQQELWDLAAEADNQNRYRIRWADWRAYLEDNADTMSQTEMAAEISMQIGFDVSQPQLSAAMKSFGIKKARVHTSTGR